MDIDTLTVIQQERYNAFRHQADQLRLLRTLNETSDAPSATATTGHARTGVIAALRQMVMLALQTHSRAVPPR